MLFIALLLSLIGDSHSAVVGNLAARNSLISSSSLTSAFKNMQQMMMTTYIQGLVQSEATRMITARLSTHFFAAACVRDYSAICPTKWQENTAEASCSPPESYHGPCASDELSVGKEASIEKKMEISIRCQVEWPCRTCSLDFESCPLGWTRTDKNKMILGKGVDFRDSTYYPVNDIRNKSSFVETAPENSTATSFSCTAPVDYPGSCDRQVSFANASDKTKAKWATRCDAKWPCEPVKVKPPTQPPTP